MTIIHLIRNRRGEVYGGIVIDVTLGNRSTTYMYEDEVTLEELIAKSKEMERLLK